MSASDLARLLGGVVLLTATACGTRPKPSGAEPVAPPLKAQSTQEASVAAYRTDQDRSQTDQAPQEEPPPPAAPPRVLPEGLVLGKSAEIPMDRDRALRVAHAPASTDHAVVYLHGMCGNPEGAEPFLDRVLKEGTLVVVRANVPCPDRPGYKWPKDPALIQGRIDAALAKVKELRGGVLDTEEVTLVGYSQGAHRAELLVAAQPQRYRAIVLGGPPTAPLPESFPAGSSVAILGGELENTDHMEAGATALAEAGLRARFFRLPGAHHGDYGPNGPQVMDQVFTWLSAPSR